MFETKKYQWLLSELSKSKAKLKFLEATFIKSGQVESSFNTGSEGIISSSQNKGTSIKDTLEKYLFKRMNGLESSETIKAVAYMLFASYKRVVYINDVKELLRKDQKLHNLKEIILIQEYQHEPTTFYTLELYYDGEGLVSTLYRRDINNETMIKDNKFLYLTLNLSKYLVSSIENLIDKNVIRLNYDFVVDQNFCPVVFYISLIKLVHPKIIALNKGINVDGLENLTLVKNDYKGLVYPKVPTLVKEPEPDPETTNLVPVTKPESASIFMSFISKFLDPEKKTIKRKMTFKTAQTFASEQVSPVPFLQMENKSIDSDSFPSKTLTISRSPPPLISELGKSSFSHKDFKLPDLKTSGSSKHLFHKHNYFFPNLQPSDALSSFLKIEEERLLELKSKRLANSEMLRDTLPAIKKQKKKKKKSKKKSVKKPKKSSSAQKFLSPYEISQNFK